MEVRETKRVKSMRRLQSILLVDLQKTVGSIGMTRSQEGWDQLRALQIHGESWQGFVRASRNCKKLESI